jgi:hypothetical protein
VTGRTFRNKNKSGAAAGVEGFLPHICVERRDADVGHPATHKDPFDRILVAQATVEGITLLTNDRRLLDYPGPVRKV